MPITTSKDVMVKLLRKNGLLKSLVNLQQSFYTSSYYNYSANASSETILKTNPKLIIIGAGISGLSAADHLIKNGFKNIEILEASDRFGGRIFTKKFGDAICELGAKYINKNNTSKSIYDFIKNDYDYEELKDLNQKTILTSKGEKLNPQIVLKASQEFNMLLEKSSFLKNTILIDTFNNSKVYLEKETEKLAKTLFKKDSQEASQIFNTLINDYCSFFGCDLSKIHVYQLSKTSPFYNNRITINNGMYTVFKPLMNDIDSEQIVYSKPIGKIEWSRLEPLKQIQITCLDNTEYIADHVICTLPLGILKTFHSLLFEPGLSIEKIAAIDNLGVSTPGQFYFKYHEDVNKWFVGSIKPAWSSTELSNHRNISRDIIEISTIPNSKNVLEFKRIGDEDFERLNDGKIIKETTNLLRKLLNNPDIPYPNDMIQSNWGTDTKFLGGLPVSMKANSEKFVENLSKPCSTYEYADKSETPKILFAGDATDWDGFGTLDGARCSGIREAQRILDYYKQNTNREF